MASNTHPLLPNPPDIAALRQGLFEIPHEGIVLSKADHLALWPYLSNVWSISKSANREITDYTGYATSYWICRFRRARIASTSTTTAQNTSRQHYNSTKCDCRIRVREFKVAGVVQYMPLGGFPHTHTLDDMDRFKINNAVKHAVEGELVKGYPAKDVAKAFLSNDVDGAYHALVAAGGQYLDRARIQSWKQGLKTSVSRGDKDS